MTPTFQDGDKLFVSKLYYRIFSPKPKDIIVLKDPRSRRLILKRIIKIDGKKYFVQGDNSLKSTDSRQFGGVNKKTIVGKVLFRYFSAKN